MKVIKSIRDKIEKGPLRKAVNYKWKIFSKNKCEYDTEKSKIIKNEILKCLEQEN